MISYFAFKYVKTRDVEHIFTGSLVIRVSSFVKCQNLFCPIFYCIVCPFIVEMYRIVGKVMMYFLYGFHRKNES